MKIIRLELFKTLRLISKSKLRLRFFAGFSSTLRVFARPAGDSRRCARKRAKPAKEFRNLLSLRRIFLASVIASFLILSSANAQQAKGELRGQVVDEFGGLVVGATVTLTDAVGVAKSIATNNEGIYLFSGLAPGLYTLRVEAHGFSLYESADVEVKAGSREPINIKLTVALEKQEVNVGAETNLSTASENNATALVLNSAELGALPDDPDDLAAALQAIAGPSAGPSGGEIFVDGFAGGRVPPKNTIREVRINSNPFSAEYRNLGFGRIEIFTKPGTDKFHGQGNASFSNQSFNSRNPFASNRAPYKYLTYGASLSGPVKAKRASFFLDFERRDINDNSIINATVLGPTLNITPFGLSVLVPQHRTTFSPRFDYQINQKNTLIARYTFLHQGQQNAGVGNFSLLSRAYSTAYTEQTIQLTETAVINPRAVNETRFQYSHQENLLNGDNSTPTINVLDAFISGGSNVGRWSNDQDRFEFQNYTTFVVNHQTFKTGVRLRDVRVSDIAPVNFGGTYTFAGGVAPALDANNQIVFTRDQQTGNLAPALVQISSLERYRRTLLFAGQGLTPEETRSRGGGATQLSLAGGDPEARVNQAEFNLFIQDEWTLRPNLTLSLGLRYEAQSNVQNRFNFAPRFAFAYAPNAAAGKTKTVIRGGFGIFFDRFSENLSLQAKHFESEQQFISLDPNILGLFPALPSLAALMNSIASRTSIQLDPHLQLPYTMQGAINVERQLPHKFIFTATLLSARALHLLRSLNINAPLPGTNIRPLGDARGNVFQYESTGRLNQNQLILSLRNSQSSKRSIILTYLLNKAMSDTDGPETFPVNSYDLRSEYGRSDLDIRHRFLMSGVFSFKHSFSLNPFILAASGRPFNITTGRDANGDTLFTERPSFATDQNQPGVILTRFGAFNANPRAGEQLIPRNYGTSAPFFTISLRASKTWGFGEAHSATSAPKPQTEKQAKQQTGKGKGNTPPARGSVTNGSVLPDASRSDFFGRSSESRYKLTLSIVARNIFNRTNPGRFVGNLNSLLFGQSNILAPPYGFGDSGDTNAANRRIEAQVRFTF
ncbi:MAG: hypothetical protein DMF68_03595 [Acidobacteria bacterium]|nr:MAG: hypothetical protein DMF68_03595 [Acidobacteriota bacterium]